MSASSCLFSSTRDLNNLKFNTRKSCQALSQQWGKIEVLLSVAQPPCDGCWSDHFDFITAEELQIMEAPLSWTCCRFSLSTREKTSNKNLYMTAKAECLIPTNSHVQLAKCFFPTGGKLPRKRNKSKLQSEKWTCVGPKTKCTAKSWEAGPFYM